jgi:hypothetical protein
MMCGGSLWAWIERGTLHVKAGDHYGDPIEPSEIEVRVLIEPAERLSSGRA